MSIIFPGRLRNATQATSRSKLFPIQLLRCGESLNLITLNFRDYNRVCPFVSPAWWVEKSFGKAETPRLCGVENQEVLPPGAESDGETLPSGLIGSTTGLSAIIRCRKWMLVSMKVLILMSTLKVGAH